MNQQAMVPIEPIRELVERRIREWEAEHDRSGLEAVIDRISLVSGKSTNTVQRNLHRIRSGFDTCSRGPNKGKKVPVKSVSLDYADQIICALDHPILFWTDPRLRKAYELD